MDWVTTLGDINLAAVVLAVGASFAVGFVWYHPKVFGEMWRKGAGLTKKEMNSTEGMAATFGGTIVFGLISTAFLAAVLIAINTETAAEGALNGAIIGATIVGLRLGIHNFFAKKSLDHTLIEAGYDIVVMAIQGAILGAFV